MVVVPDSVEVDIGPHRLKGLLGIPLAAEGLVIFAHGSGSGRLSPRNNRVAATLREVGLATLLLDLLTPQEERDRRNVFDIALLASRLALATEWTIDRPETAPLSIGYFGASTGAAIVSRGGRPDQAGDALPQVVAPTLLIVGSLDTHVIELNRMAYDRLKAPKELVIIEGAGHLFEEPGTLDEVQHHAMRWFLYHLSGNGGA